MNVCKYMSNIRCLIGMAFLAIIPIAHAGTTTSLATTIASTQTVSVDASKTMVNDGSTVTNNGNSQITLTVTDNSTAGYLIQVKGTKGYLDIAGGNSGNTTYKTVNYFLQCNTESSTLEDAASTAVSNSFSSATQITTSNNTIFTHTTPTAPTVGNSSTCTVSATGLNTKFQGVYSDTLTFTITAPGS
jgi:hypothetical protein